MVYSRLPRGTLNFIPLQAETQIHGKGIDFVIGLQGIHKTMFDNLIAANTCYNQHADELHRHVEFDVDCFVWAMLPKEHFLVGDYNKLKYKKIGPVEIIEKIKPNAYQLNLPIHIRTTDIFKVKNLVAYYGDSSDDDNLRGNYVQPRRMM